ncbi:MAG: thioesterase family protein [Rhodospirillaceae bacterium]|nr:thioesterase family protein [Rhodospirillaceae bacterium]
MQQNSDTGIETPFVADAITVLPEWIDYNGHLNVAYYLHAFDLGYDAVFEKMGFGSDVIRERNASGFAAELHLTFQRELLLGDRLRITTQLLGFDAKRCRMFQSMYHHDSNELAATCEWMSLYIDMTKRRVTEMPAELQRRLARVIESHGKLPAPPESGRGISLGNRRRD